MTTYHTLKGEKLLKQAGVKYKTIMKPRHISSDCGLAITFEAERFPEVAAVFREAFEPEIIAGYFDYRDNTWVDSA